MNITKGKASSGVRVSRSPLKSFSHNAEKLNGNDLKYMGPKEVKQYFQQLFHLKVSHTACIMPKYEQNMVGLQSYFVQSPMPLQNLDHPIADLKDAKQSTKLVEKNRNTRKIVIMDVKPPKDDQQAWGLSKNITNSQDSFQQQSMFTLIYFVHCCFQYYFQNRFYNKKTNQKFSVILQLFILITKISYSLQLSLISRFEKHLSNGSIFDHFCNYKFICHIINNISRKYNYQVSRKNIQFKILSMENQRIWTNRSNFIKQIRNDYQANIKEQSQFEESLGVPILFDNSCAQCFKRFRKRKLISTVTQSDPYISEFYYKNQHECFSKDKFQIEKNGDQLQIFQHQKCKVHQLKTSVNCVVCDNIISKRNYYKCQKCKAQFYFQNEFTPILECPECNFKFCKLCKRQHHLFNHYACTCYYDYGYTNSFYLLLLIVFQILIFPILVYGRSFQVGMEIASVIIPKVIELYFYTGKYIFLLLILPLIAIYLLVFLVLYWIYIIPKSVYLSALDIYELMAQIYRNFYIE